jgi:hypothetical protein
MRQEPVEASDSESEMPMTKEERARHDLAKQALRNASSPQRVQMIPTSGGTALSFKRKENSTSGDDKALEKVIRIHNRDHCIG